MSEAKVTVISNHSTILHFPFGTRNGVAIIFGNNEVKASVWSAIAASKDGAVFVGKGTLVGPKVEDAVKAPSTAEIIKGDIEKMKAARKADHETAATETNKIARKGKE